MMKVAQVEYVGFKTEGAARQYTLRVRQATGESQDFTLAISTEAFLAHRARYQDAPEICFLKLQRELAASADSLPASYLSVTDAELEEYRTAHAPPSPRRRPKPAPVS
jgi:hypothetical protein